LLKRDGDSVSAINEALRRASEAHAEAVATLERLADERTRALMADDEKALDAIEKNIALAARDRDRAQLATTELNRRLAAVQERDRQAMLDGLHKQASAARDKAVALLRGDYAKHARALAKVVAEIETLDAERETLNLQLMQAGDGRQVGSPDDVARPSHGPVRLMPVPVYKALVLPDPADGCILLHPAGKDIFGGPALRQDRAA
jgi:hypothetical protein